MTRSVCRQSVRVRNLMVLVVSPFLTSLAAFKWIDPVLVSLDRLIPSLLKYLKLPCGLPSNLNSRINGCSTMPLNVKIGKMETQKKKGLKF
uniref:Uncharacterized protein n=1 Tax=Rhizophora mucronata TaxID=61149 RepID=A0A2P2J8H0_RHIMU